MADLQDFSAGPVATSIIEFYAKRAPVAPAFLEASTVGGPCDRALWLAFRMCTKPVTDGAAVRRLDTDERVEARFVFDLREVGVEVYDRDPETRDRFIFKDHAGHLRGVMDACTHNVPGGGDQWHVTEFATLDAATFARLSEKGVSAVCFDAWDNMQLLMGSSGMTRALYLAENVTDGSVFAERVPFDPVYFERLRARAESIIFVAEAPPRAFEDPTEDTCRACAAHDACHGMRVPAVSCRTCCYSTPERDGDAHWSCCHPSKPRHDLPLELQRTGCDDHLVLPFLVNYAAVVEAGESGWILFQRYDTGRLFVVASATAMPPADMFAAYDSPAMYHSAELAAAHDHRMIGNPDVEKLRSAFDGRVAA
jgi:hypothetical protein